MERVSLPREWEAWPGLMKSICPRETDEVGPHRSDGDRIRYSCAEPSCVFFVNYGLSIASYIERKQA